MEEALEILKFFQKRELVHEDTQFDSTFYAHAIIEIEKYMKPKSCEWEYNEFDEAWDGKCGVKFQIAFDTPKENHMKFCPQCGGKLIEI